MAENEVLELRLALSESQRKLRQWKSKYYRCRADLVEEMASTCNDFRDIREKSGNGICMR